MPVIADALTTLQASALDDVREWLADNPDADSGTIIDAIELVAYDHAPAITSVLFGLVVDNNSLAFRELDHGDVAHPFEALRRAVADEIAEYVRDAMAEYL